MKDIIRDLPVAVVAVITAIALSVGAVKTVNAQAAEESKTNVRDVLPTAGAATLRIEPAEVPQITIETAEPVEEDETETTAWITADRDDVEQYMMAKIVMAEAEGESLKGKALVAKVIKNRQANEQFPDTVVEVINQPGAFSCISDGRYHRVEPTEECWQAVELVLNGWDESEGALFFEKASNKDTWQSRNRPKLFTEGGHTFYG